MYTNRKKHMRVGVFYDVENSGVVSNTPPVEIPVSKETLDKKSRYKQIQEQMQARYKSLRDATMAKVLARLPDTIPVKI
jgi:hypothetical protein